MSVAKAEENHSTWRWIDSNDRRAILIDDRISRTITLDIGGCISLAGWQTRELHV